MNKPSTISQLISDADLCVMCGMCLPHCPTYQLYQSETESPRGRIALIQSIEKGKLKANASALLHIDHCLGCLNCETICPSRVPYGQLIDGFRQKHTKQLNKPFASQQILKYAAKPDGLRKLGSFVSKPVINQLLKAASPITGIPATLINKPEETLQDYYPTSKASRGDVYFFTGCTGKQSDAVTLKDTAFIVNQLGFDVYIPQEQHCCGAMHQHNGQTEVAQQLLDNNQTQFNSLETKAILVFSPACTVSLQQLNNSPVIDARVFINEQLQQRPLNFKPCTQAVALHESCSHRNMLKRKDLNQQLLQHIEHIEIHQSSLPALCCGAGGLQAINYPQQANALRKAKLDSFDLSQANIFLSDNIGCSQHIKSTISAYNPDIEVLHPLSLLARQLISQS